VPDTSSHTLVLYDGVCGLCNGLNRFLLKRDPNDHFRFASLQSEFASSLLDRYHINAVDLDTVYVVVDYDEPNQLLLAKSDAILHVLGRLGGVWGLLRIGKALPKSWRDVLYDVVARNRYRVFGKSDVCLMPEERYQRKFLDMVALRQG
jgi:predicted DCC family thiol-disulfide oxidoreductase YuxK